MFISLGGGVLEQEDCQAKQSIEVGIKQTVVSREFYAFPDTSVKGNKVLTTIDNLEYLLNALGIVVEYDVIAKKVRILIPSLQGTTDNADNVSLAHILSLATKYGLSTKHVPEFIEAIADRHPINSVTNWIESKPWDGVDRKQAFFDTLTVAEYFPVELKNLLIHKWLLSAIASAMTPSGFYNRGVLTLQGEQSMGKTSWIKNLVSDPLLRDRVIKLGHHLDAGDKDSMITAIGHWIVEIGELDSSFKKDVARLKGFLTSDRDKVRRPYARTAVETPRKTVFAATVNDCNFLVDPTGNTRFWTLPLVALNYDHGIDMQQLFAQIMLEFKAGQQWWLSPSQEVWLESFNQSHRIVSVIEETIFDALDLDRKNDPDLKLMTSTQLLIELGFKTPTNQQCREVNNALRKLLGETKRKRVKGYTKWLVPLKENRIDGLLGTRPKSHF
jgi:putative DNA primase/helicase